MFNLEDYETVEARLEKFWKDNPDGLIYTDLIEHSATRFIVKAGVFRTENDARPWATGYAEETIAARGVNATSALENCETSAIGRALANANYATKGKRPSREEMSKVQTIKQTQSAIDEAKQKMAQTSKEYVPVPKEDDPWTIRDAAPVTTIDDAVNTVKDIIGEQSEIPKCPTCDHDMTWRTGTSKAGKAWANFSCKRGSSGSNAAYCNQVIWYEVSPAGKWVPQKARA